MTLITLIRDIEAGPVTYALEVRIRDAIHPALERVPTYLGNLQDATLAVPEGWYPGLDPIFFEDGERVLYDAILLCPHWDKWNPVDREWLEFVEARAETMPRALTLAALKAREREAEG